MPAPPILSDKNPHRPRSHGWKFIPVPVSTGYRVTCSVLVERRGGGRRRALGRHRPVDVEVVTRREPGRRSDNVRRSVDLRCRSAAGAVRVRELKRPSDSRSRDKVRLEFRLMWAGLHATWAGLYIKFRFSTEFFTDQIQPPSRARLKSGQVGRHPRVENGPHPCPRRYPVSNCHPYLLDATSAVGADVAQPAGARGTRTQHREGTPQPRAYPRTSVFHTSPESRPYKELRAFNNHKMK